MSLKNENYQKATSRKLVKKQRNMKNKNNICDGKEKKRQKLTKKMEKITWHKKKKKRAKKRRTINAVK